MKQFSKGRKINKQLNKNQYIVLLSTSCYISLLYFIKLFYKTIKQSSQKQKNIKNPVQLKCIYKSEQNILCTNKMDSTDEFQSSSLDPSHCPQNFGKQNFLSNSWWKFRVLPMPSINDQVNQKYLTGLVAWRAIKMTETTTIAV